MAVTSFVDRDGAFGQVEPNRLTGIVSGNMESQAPAYQAVTASGEDSVPIAQLENGQFLCVVIDDTGKVPGASMGRVAVYPENAAATDVPYLVFSEKKIYDERKGYADFVDKAADKVDGILYPRLIGLTPDTDVYTTNTINHAKYTPDTPNIAAGDKLYIGEQGYLTTVGADAKNTVLMFEVCKVYTMPDGQTGLKLRVKNYVAPTTTVTKTVKGGKDNV